MLKYYKTLLKDFKEIPGTVIIYGSVSNEKSRPDSDIDIAIISNNKNARNKAEELADKILFKKGRVISILWLSLDTLKKRYHEPFIQNVLDGEIIHGRNLLKRINK